MRLVFLLLLALRVSAQDTIYFTKALSVNAPVRYGREALYMDELAYQLYNGTLQTPFAGKTFLATDNAGPITWKTLEADSLHRLRSAGAGFGARGRGPTYLYLTYQSDKARTAIINIKGNAGFFLNGEPHMGDAYSSGWMYVPVKLKKGLNEFYVRGSFITADMFFPSKNLMLNTEDATVPSIVAGSTNKQLSAAVVVINGSEKKITGASIRSILNGKEKLTKIPDIPAMGMRKVAFEIDPSAVNSTGRQVCKLSLIQNGKPADQADLVIDAPEAGAQYSETFTSAIDGSLQYYAVTPQTSSAPSGNALFLSVHGAGVEAIGQARAYKPKDWGTLVAATNRRPRGFNWEDWGRIDALEVLELAKNKFQPDPAHVYLTGHSMGGHGTWFLGATYPDKWAAIAPCAGYPTLKGYGSADGLIPDSSNNPIEKILLRSSNQSDVIKLADNYKSLGVYVFHGDNDRTVSVNYARQMKKILSEFHPDFSYYEYPGGEHWFGDQSVDWKPLFDFFKWHQKPADTSIHTIDFTTASPGISSSVNWAAVMQQQHPLEYSRIRLARDRSKSTVTGTTENVKLLKLILNDFSVGSKVNVKLDGTPAIEFAVAGASDSLFLVRTAEGWTKSVAPSADQKNPLRYGTFKDAFNHQVIFVYGTTGSAEENKWSQNKARFDAETWYYRGNGSVDIISDKEYDAEKYKDRGVVIFGNEKSNAAYKALLADCPIKVSPGKITAGNNTFEGDQLAAYFVWPLKGSAKASVAVIAGTGIKGMQATNANQYFAGASGFPDFMIYHLDMLHEGTRHLKMAGFFDNDWKLVPTEMSVTD